MPTRPTTRAVKDDLAERGVANGILARANKHHPLSAAQRVRNKALNRVRCRVEGIFATMKRIYGYTRVRYIGRAKNRLQFTLLCMALNLRRALVLTA